MEPYTHASRLGSDVLLGCVEISTALATVTLNEGRGGNVTVTVWIERVGAKSLGYGGPQEGPEASGKESTEGCIWLGFGDRNLPGKKKLP